MCYKNIKKIKKYGFTMESLNNIKNKLVSHPSTQNIYVEYRKIDAEYRKVDLEYQI